MDSDKIRKEWERQYDRLESERELHRISFILTKKCKCRATVCKHYRAEKEKLFGRRSDRLFAIGIITNAATCGQAEMGREILKEFF